MERKLVAEISPSAVAFALEEAADLATDYNELSMRSFPREQVARSLLRGSQLTEIQAFYGAL